MAFQAPSTATFGGSDQETGSMDGLSPIKQLNDAATLRGVAAQVGAARGKMSEGGGPKPACPVRNQDITDKPATPPRSHGSLPSWECHSEEMGRTPPTPKDEQGAKNSEVAIRRTSPSTPRGGFSTAVIHNKGLNQDKKENH